MKEQTVNDILGTIAPPPHVLPILGQAGASWSKAQFESVLDWVTDEKGRAFNAMLLLVRRQLRIKPRSVHVDPGTVTGFDRALDREAVDRLLHFLTDQFARIIQSFAPEESGPFLCHLCGQLRCHLDVALPPELLSIARKSKETRTVEEIKRFVEWLAKNWHTRLLQVARAHLGGCSTSEDAEEAVQGYFESKPRTRAVRKQEATPVDANAVKVVRSFKPAEGGFWHYLRICFVRYCWKRTKKLNAIYAHEVPMPTAVDSEGEGFDVEFPDTGLIPPDVKAAQDEIRHALKRCLSQLSSVARSVIIGLYFDQLRVEEVARALGLSRGNVRVIGFRALRRLSTMPEVHELHTRVHSP